MTDLRSADLDAVGSQRRGRAPLLILGIIVLVTLIVLGLVAVRHAMQSSDRFAPGGWYYSRFVVQAADGGTAPAAARDAVAQVEMSRLSGWGVRQAKIRMAADGFVIAVSPGTRSLLAALPDALPVVEFRPVVAVAGSDGTCTPGRTAAVMCGPDGTSYTLAAAQIRGSDLLAASAGETTRPAARDWTVLVVLTRQGAPRFATLTGRLAKQPVPRNQIAIVVDGSVVSAPTVREAITSGRLEIAGSYPQAQAKRLAAPFQAAAARVRVRHDAVSATAP
jgi:preprotein translocase subunit SecD